MQHQVSGSAILRMVSVIAVLATGLTVAQSGSGSLKKSGDFYINYGKEAYVKLQMEKDVVGLYDYFGEHIVDGVRLYTLNAAQQNLSNERRDLDSTNYSMSNEYQKSDFYEKFSNLVVTQDAIGGTKTSFLIGDQITTKFTPLTFNMVNFKGIRWDLWTAPLQASLVLSRTRPGVLSKKGISWDSPVSYPLYDGPDGFSTNVTKYDIVGHGFDDTRLTPYGDYDLLWAIHGQYNVLENLNVGVTAINHHVSDARRGTHPFKGNLPDSLMPSYIHFEFYDGTLMDTLDAGVFVDSVVMYVNDREVRAAGLFQDVFRRAFTADRNQVLVPREIPLARPQDGAAPVVVEFALDPRYWEFTEGGTLGSIRDIKKIRFSYKIAGNYTVFATTDRQMPAAVGGQYNPTTRRIDYKYPSRSVGYLYDKGINVGAYPAVDRVVYDGPISSTTYFGQYITQSPRSLSITRTAFSEAVHPANRQSKLYSEPGKYNYKRYEWTYGLNVSSETYGVNFKGEVAGVNFSGEVALNRSEYMLPGSESSRTSKLKWVGTLKASRDISSTLGIGGEAYYIAPQWMTNLDNLQASTYFSKTAYKVLEGVQGDSSYWGKVMDYMQASRPLGNEWQNIDDNDDNDPFPENARRHYPSDLDPGSTGSFYADGRLRPTNSTYKNVTLQPSNMAIPYDDPNGVMVSKSDRNKNGRPDYTEDFLLFSSDPPVFDLNLDMNNNGTSDAEEDDILPDYGYAVGYVITGDGYRSLGIKGVSLELQYKLSDVSVVSVGGRAESVADRDFVAGNEADEGVLAADKLDGQSYVGYVTARRDVIDRSAGILYNLGFELRYIRDALRNDIVDNKSWVNLQDYNYFVSYQYKVDPLSYRNALVANAVASVTYSEIRNFEYGFRIRGGIEKHLALNDEDGSLELFYRPDVLEQHWRSYPDRLVALIDLVNRVQYRMRFNIAYEDWRSMFDVLNNVEVIPQYKIAFSTRKEVQGPDETQVDPRDVRKNIELDSDGDGVIDPELDNVGSNLDSVKIESSRWNIYRSNNQAYLSSVPILKLNYKIADNTQLQFGAQWYRYFDLISPENSRNNFTLLGQVVSKANYKGFSVAFFLGAMWQNVVYDIRARDPVTDNGSRFDISGYTFFARLFSGI